MLRRIHMLAFRAAMYAIALSLGAGAAVAQPKYIGPAPPPAGKKAPSYPDIESVLPAANAGLQAAVAALGRQDKNSAKKHLQKAEEVLEKAVKTNPTHRGAAEALGMVYFYQGVAEGKSELERSAKFLKQVVDVDPEAIQGLRFLALAHSRLNNAKETVSFASLAIAMSTDTAITREMTELKRPFQEYFLKSWFEYEKYYESPAAKVTRVNPQNFQTELVFQITPQFEQDLGAKGLQQMSAQLQISQDAELQKYLQKLVDKLVAKTPGPPFNYKVDVVESPQVNALAFPGRILVNTGLLKFTESEAELITILSHELAHIYAHHSARHLVSSYQKGQVAGMLLGAVKVDNKLGETLLNVGVAAGLELLARGYSRGQEKEADRYGTHIAFNAGYNPTFMTKFFLRLYESNPKSPWKLLSTHPPTTERIEYTTQYLEAFPLETEMQIDSQEFKDMKKRLK